MIWIFPSVSDIIISVGFDPQVRSSIEADAGSDRPEANKAYLSCRA